MKAEIINYGNSHVLFNQLYESSAFTWVGLALNTEEDAMEIVKFFEEQGLIADDVEVVSFYRTSGESMNHCYRLTGDNAYPDDLTIVSILNDQLNIAKMIPIQLRFDARWFDDIVDNNRRREEER